MNPFKCRHCSRDAYWYFRDGGMLCPDHGALHATAQMKDMLERSRLVSPLIPGECAAALTLADVPSSGEAAAINSACCSLEDSGSTSNDLRVGSSGTPTQARPLTPFKNATTFRVTADNSIQGSPSSFSMGTAGHGAIVDAHNTIVRGG